LDGGTVFFKSKSHLLSVESEVGKKAVKICQEWLENMDQHLKRNLHRLTCDNVREMYFGLFGELKRWRSTAANFTGFSEFLIFRLLYHTIGEEFKPVLKGDIKTSLVRFRSENYEIGQNVQFPLVSLKRSTDIYVKRKDKLISIIQVKVGLYEGDKQINREVKTFRFFREKYPDIKGFFIELSNESGAEQKNLHLTDAGYHTIILLDNQRLISDVLTEFI
jgi:hypothetical protein